MHPNYEIDYAAVERYMDDSADALAAHLAEAPEAYKTFHEKKDRCVKVVLKPHGLAD